MFIKYNGSNVHALPYLNFKNVTLVNKKTGKRRTVQKIDTNQAPQDIQWLRPGWNEFPSNVWGQNKDNPQIVKMLKKGTIVLMDEKVVFSRGGKKIQKQVGADDSEIHLKVFDDKRAIEIVKSTFNRDLLQRWLDGETRSKVKRRLEKQIEPLLSQASDDDGDQDDEDDSSED